MYYIMSAGRLTSNRKITIDKATEIMGADGDTTILVCQRADSAWSSDTKPVFVFGSGHGYEHEPKVEKYTEDTGNGHRRKGYDLMIENVIEIKDGQIVNKLNNIGIDEKRSLWVMK